MTKQEMYDTVKTRLEKLDSVKAKVKSYETLFKTPLGDITNRIDQLKGQLNNVASRWNMLEV